MATDHSPDTTGKLFVNTERDFGLIFDGVTEMTDFLRPHPIQ
jgi:hypothetical protein